MSSAVAIRRARQDWQKEARLEAILDAAEALFGARAAFPPMSEVADAVGVAKGTLYLYFPTKEALYLSVLDRRLEAWSQAVDEAVRAADSVTRELVADRILDGALRCPVLMRLAMQATRLESQAGQEVAAEFKRTTAARIEALGATIASRTDLSPEEAARRVLHAYVFLVGLWQVADHAPVVRRVLASDEAGLDLWRIGVADHGRSGLLAIWRA